METTNTQTGNANMETATMTNDQLDAWYDGIQATEAAIAPVRRRLQAVGDLCSVLELAGIEIREEE